MPVHNVSYFLGSVRENAKGFSMLVKSFSGWYWFALFRFGLSDNALLLSRSKEGGLRSVEIDGKNGIITVSYKGREIRFGFATRAQLDNAMRNIYEIFIWEQYADLEVKGREVVDIGANNGDSAIYFTLKGAKDVYAYEPYPSSYRQAEMNVKLNGMEKTITLKNQAVMGSESSMIVDDKYDSVSNSVLRPSSSGKRIKIVCLDQIVSERNLRDAALKMDCEGAEYEIFKGAKNESIKKFSQIAIEYHFGYESLVKRLKSCGFKVTYTQPRISRNAETNGMRMNYGAIYAYR